MREVAAMLKAIHAQENKESARQKAKSVVQKLREMKLKEAADKIEKGIEETLTYMDSMPIGVNCGVIMLSND